MRCRPVVRQTQTRPNDGDLVCDAQHSRWADERIGTSSASSPINWPNQALSWPSTSDWLYGTHYCWLTTSTALQKAQLLTFACKPELGVSGFCCLLLTFFFLFWFRIRMASWAYVGTQCRELLLYVMQISKSYRLFWKQRPAVVYWHVCFSLVLATKAIRSGFP